MDIKSYKDNMNRSDLIERIAQLHPQLQLKDAEFAAKVILEVISVELSKGGHAEIRGFSSFTVNHRPSRKCHNFKIGESVMVPAKYVPHFKMGKEMRERVDNG